MNMGTNMVRMPSKHTSGGSYICVSLLLNHMKAGWSDRRRTAPCSVYDRSLKSDLSEKNSSKALG